MLAMVIVMAGSCSAQLGNRRRPPPPPPPGSPRPPPPGPPSNVPPAPLTPTNAADRLVLVSRPACGVCFHILQETFVPPSHMHPSRLLPALVQFVESVGTCLAQVASNWTQSVLLLPPLPSSPFTPAQAVTSTQQYLNYTVNLQASASVCVGREQAAGGRFCCA